MGERPEEAGAAGALILSGVGAGEVVGRERAPLFRPGRGNREGDARGGGESGLGRLGRGGFRGGGPVWAGVQWGNGPSPFFSVLFCFLFSFYLFISFSVLFHLKYLGIL